MRSNWPESSDADGHHIGRSSSSPCRVQTVRTGSDPGNFYTDFADVVNVTEDIAGKGKEMIGKIILHFKQ